MMFADEARGEGLGDPTPEFEPVPLPPTPFALELEGEPDERFIWDVEEERDDDDEDDVGSRLLLRGESLPE